MPQWLSAAGQPMTARDWSAGDLAAVGLILGEAASEGRLALWFNRGALAVDVHLPAARDGCAWAVALASGGAGELRHGNLAMAARSVAVLEEKSRPGRGPSDEEVAALAAAAGIQPDWWETGGAHRTVGLDTKRALLGALGFSLASAADVREALRALGQPRASGIASPAATCHLPDFVGEGGRVFGLSSHLYALRDARDAGIGDFETLARFAETAARLGGALVGINPLHHLFTGRSRPRQPLPAFRPPLSRSHLYRRRGPRGGVRRHGGERFAGGARSRVAELRQRRYVDYAAVWRVKQEVLVRAFAIFERALRSRLRSLHRRWR